MKATSNKHRKTIKGERVLQQPGWESAGGWKQEKTNLERLEIYVGIKL